MTFKVEIRTTCKVCLNPIKVKRFRSYCSDECRNKFFNKKYKVQHSEWQRARSDRIASVSSPNKIQCLVCKRYYVQVCSHVVLRHSDQFASGREYREYYDLEVKKGIVPPWYRDFKGRQAVDNGTYKNLQAGAQFRFKKGQEGVGVYKRSHVTMKKLKVLHLLNKNG